MYGINPSQYLSTTASVFVNRIAMPDNLTI
jgi:hypothetical protein